MGFAIKTILVLFVTFFNISSTDAVKFFSFEQIKYEYFVVNGIKDGNYISYFKGGNILEEGTYKEGIKDGPWIKFDQYYNRERKLIHFKSSEYIFKDGMIRFAINLEYSTKNKRIKPKDEIAIFPPVSGG